MFRIAILTPIVTFAGCKTPTDGSHSDVERVDISKKTKARVTVLFRKRVVKPTSLHRIQTGICVGPCEDFDDWSHLLLGANKGEFNLMILKLIQANKSEAFTDLRAKTPSLDILEIMKPVHVDHIARGQKPLNSAERIRLMRLEARYGEYIGEPDATMARGSFPGLTRCSVAPKRTHPVALN